MCGVKFGAALGLTWALFMFVASLAAWQFGYGVDMVTAFGTVYHGFAASFMGALAGAFWGFIHAFIFGFVLTWIYKKLDHACCKKEECSDKDKKGGCCG